ncbi:MAG: hypothetical protein NT027_01835, partial [Proteobacteria bacterium]|nr:hypothetical protein [Pseudomonadota bacterium]
MSSSIFSDQDIDLIIELGRELTGTQLDRLKHSVVIHNLASRINQLGKSSLEEYLQFVEDHDDEMPYLTSALTIHTTSWFREANAFDQLKTILLKQAPSYSLGKPFRVLSVACSTGEEVYSIASILESTKLKSPQFDYSVEGWDVDPISLRTAKSGRYDSNL